MHITRKTKKGTLKIGTYRIRLSWIVLYVWKSVLKTVDVFSWFSLVTVYCILPQNRSSNSEFLPVSDYTADNIITPLYFS